jgi:uncharacterized membrane protein
MKELILKFLSNCFFWEYLSDSFKVFFIAMTPILEIRGSLPLGIFYYKLPILETFFFSVLGNILIVIPLIIFLNYFTKILSKNFKVFDIFFTKLFEKTKIKHSNKIDIYGSLALILLVAIPFPGTGAWTGSLISYVFKIPYKKAFPLISLGVIIAGLVTLFISLGINIFI